MKIEITERDRILTALDKWIRQRPGLDFRNYGCDASAYRSELRSITKDLTHARALLKAVEWRTSIGVDELKEAFRSAFAGRLSWDGNRLSYVTGQYWPTEYRRAVCAVLASALWAYARENGQGNIGKGSPGDNLRAWAKKEFGLAIQKRFFA